MIRFDGIQKILPVNTGVNFKTETETNKVSASKVGITELPNIKTPLNINIPSSYTKLDVKTLDNGQEIHNYKLSNGLRVSILPMDTNSTIIRTFVNTGAINENDKQRGISHFLEHMAFNGTNGSDGYKKLSTGDVFRLVGNIGGSTNAATNFALTDYYIQAPIFNDSDLEEIISIQGAMMNDLELSNSMIEKERGAVISEINMYTDFPETYAYNLALKNLYNLDTTSDDYVAGRVENIKNLTQENVREYYKNNYHPANMYTTLAGDVNPDEAIKLIAKHFHTTPKNPLNKKVNSLKPTEKSIRRDIVSPKAHETTGYIFFNGPENRDLKNSIIIKFLDILLLGNSYTPITEPFINDSTIINMGGEKISTRPEDNQAVYFEFTTLDKDAEKPLNVIFDAIANFKTPTDEELNLVKKQLINILDKQLQTPEGILDILGTSHFNTGDCSIADYKKTIQSITADDITNCVNKFFNLNKASIAVVHPQKDINNTIDKSNINFKGFKEKRLLKPENIGVYTLNNNYDVAAYNTKSDFRYLNFELYCEEKPDIIPGTDVILDYILSEETKKFPKKTLEQLLSKHLITNKISVHDDSIIIKTNSNKEDMDVALAILKEQLLNPNFTQENLEKAKKQIKKVSEVIEPDSQSLIEDHALANLKNYYNKEEVLANIDKISLEDVKKLYKYILENGTGTVTFTTNENDSEYTKNILENITTLPTSKVKTFKDEDNYEQIKEPTVLTYKTNNAQADISIGYKYKTNYNLRDKVIFSILDGLLTKIAFNDLREKQQLAYSVYTNNKTYDYKNGIFYCNILTTTEDDQTGEQLYENVENSILGYQKLINDIKSGNFTDEEFEAAKLEYKGELLRAHESNKIKIQTIKNGLTSRYGALKGNYEYTMIDKITKDDIINAANYIFDQEPIYSVTANKNTLDENQKFFEKLANRQEEV